MLRAPLDVRFDPEFLQLAAQGRRDAVDQRLPLTSTRFDQARDLSVRPRVERLERQILELPLHILNAEAVRERRVDLQRLGRDPPLLLLGERSERAHVVETVGELDQQDPDVARHGHDHLADVLGLLLLASLELDPLQLGQPVDDARDLLAELLLDLGHRDVGVLHRVVQQRGGDRRRVQVQVGQDRGDGDRMHDEVLAGEPLLALVRRLRDRVRSLDLLEVGLRVVTADVLQQRLDRARAGPLARTQARKQAAAPLLGLDLFATVHGRASCGPV